MSQMMGIDRVGRILKRQKVDRIAVCEAFWTETIRRWTAEGHLSADESPVTHFNFDLENFNPFRLMGDYLQPRKVVSETDEAVLYEDGNGVLQKRLKLTTNVPQLLSYKVKTRADWEEYLKPLLKPIPDRLNLEGYRQAMEQAHAAGRFFFASSMNVFELLRALCGHETILMAMALEPEWIEVMVQVYANLIVSLMEILFAKAGKPDGVWFYEDMGFKGHTFFSPDMYRDLIKPAHRLTWQFAHSQGLQVVCHSCGMVEPLVPDMIDAGMDCLQAMEVKAGMDLVRLYRQFGDRISFIGGMDTRVLLTNDLHAVDQELEEKIPVVTGRYGYILHSDHSVPSEVDYATYHHFVQRGVELGTYKA